MGGRGSGSAKDNYYGRPFSEVQSQASLLYNNVVQNHRDVSLDIKMAKDDVKQALKSGNKDSINHYKMELSVSQDKLWSDYSNALNSASEIRKAALDGKASSSDFMKALEKAQKIDADIKRKYKL